MYKIYDNKFIGYNQHFKEEEFTGGDTKELLYENLKTMPEDWYYRNVKITYKRNSWGHRCKEYIDIDSDNYILSVGCSLTEGIGLEIEKTYTYLLAEKLNCDYYNLGVGGSGVDVMIHNLIMWLADMPHKPKLIILQWPYWGRFVHFDLAPTSCELIENGLYPAAAHSPSRDVTKMFVHGEEINYFETVETLNKIKIEHLLAYTYNIPFIHTGVKYGNRKPLEFKNDFVTFNKVDYARDNHFGIESHKKLATDLYEIAVNKYNL